MTSPRPRSSMSVGLIHDYLLVMRGAERLFAAIAECWPDAPLYTTVYSAAGTDGRFAGRQVHTSYLQRLRVGQRGFRRLLPLYPKAVERLPVQRHDLLISSSSAFAHGIRPRPGAIHVCACHTPFRYAWHERDRALAEAPRYIRPLVERVLGRMRRWDVSASTRVTHFIALSELARQRIRGYYGQDASLILPGVDMDRFSPGNHEDFLLVVGELVPHKRVGVALEAAKRAGRRVKVVGEGPRLESLRSGYGSVAEFLGRLPDPELADLYSRAAALVVPNVEEFGLAAVESQAAGRPVIAIDAGGARHTVVDGETGVLVRDGSLDELAEAMREVDFDRFDPTRIRRNAERFSVARFKRRFKAEVERLAGLPPA